MNSVSSASVSGSSDDPCCCHDAVTRTSPTRATRVRVLVSELVRRLHGDGLVDCVAVIGVHRRCRRQVDGHLRHSPASAPAALVKVGQSVSWVTLARIEGTGRVTVTMSRPPLSSSVPCTAARCGASTGSGAHSGGVTSDPAATPSISPQHAVTSFGGQHRRRIPRREPARFDQQVGHRNRPGGRDLRITGVAHCLPPPFRIHRPLPPPSAQRHCRHGVYASHPRRTMPTIRRIGDPHCSPGI